MSKVNVRYIVSDVDIAIPFYTDMLDFKVVMHPAPGFASLSRRDLTIAAQPAGRRRGWTSYVDWSASESRRLEPNTDRSRRHRTTVEKLKAAGARFRNEIVTGNGGKQILIEDPSGNPIELFQSF
jgi:catechol 2,3-dioxygenase-like lactoylglutathione lyase family enzyme